MPDRSARLTVVLLLVLFGAACRKDQGPLYVPEPVDPGEPVDTVYFSSEVQPIFNAHCWTCHPPMAGLDLSTTEAHASLVGVTSTNHAPAVRVVPGDPEASVLWNKISFTEVYGLGMPPDGTFLSAEEIETIRAWIEQAALNN